MGLVLTALQHPASSNCVLCSLVLSIANSSIFGLSDLCSPDTGELSMRFGIHSGPVTAGVLRGEKSRFQLFGDTVNTGTQLLSSVLDIDLARSGPCSRFVVYCFIDQLRE